MLDNHDCSPAGTASQATAAFVLTQKIELATDGIHHESTIIVKPGRGKRLVRVHHRNNSLSSRPSRLQGMQSRFPGGRRWPLPGSLRGRGTFTPSARAGPKSHNRMRAKGSERNKQIAVFFSNVVSLSEPNNGNIDCIGPKSLFAAFAQCFPTLTRDGKDPKPENKQGVSMIEMNKSLMGAGYDIYRKREYASGICKRGVRRWRSRRWVDFSSNEDMTHLVSKLNELHAHFPDTRSLTAQNIIFNVSDIVPSEPSCIQDVSASNDGMDQDMDVAMASDSSPHHSLSLNYSPGSSGDLLESLNESVLRCFSLARQLRLRFLGQSQAPTVKSCPKF